MNAHRKRLLGLAGLLLISPLLVRAQDSHVDSGSTNQVRPYPDSADGLRLLLQDAIAAARSGDNQKVAAFVKGMEIPDYKKWWPDTYGKDKGKGWAGAYGRDLAQNQDEMQKMLIKFGGEDGAVFTRKVNDAPEGDERGLEWGLVHSARKPVEVFYAEWRGSANARPDFIGYFMLVKRTFGWDSNIHRVQFSTIAEAPGPTVDRPEQPATPTADGAAGTSRAGKNGVGYPSCLYCPAPSYTADARKAKLEGVVVLLVMIEPDGRAGDIQIQKKLGLGLDEKAIDAVRSWRFKPATGPDGNPVPTLTPVEVTFRLR
jgi:TonB family protein